MAQYKFRSLAITQIINYGLTATRVYIPEVVYCRLQPARNRINSKYLNNLSEVSCTTADEDSW